MLFDGLCEEGRKPSFLLLAFVSFAQRGRKHLGLTTGQMQDLRRIAGDIAEREGCLLYDLEFAEGPRRTLRVYIEKDSGGASLDDCVSVSHGLNLALDVEDLIPGSAYDLEVSTPGLERKLTQAWHFKKAIGESVRLHLRKGETPAVVEGLVDGVQEDETGISAVIVVGKAGPVTVTLDKIVKAKQLFKPEKNEKPRGGSSRQKKQEKRGQ